MLENETFYFYLTRDVLLSYSFFFFLFYCFVSFRFFARGGERERGKFYPLILNRIKISSRIIRCVDVKFFLICFSYVLINIFFFFFAVCRTKDSLQLASYFRNIFFVFFNQRNCNCPHTRNRSLVVTTEVQQIYNYLNCITHFRLSRALYWNFF